MYEVEYEGGADGAQGFLLWATGWNLVPTNKTENLKWELIWEGQWHSNKFSFQFVKFGISKDHNVYVWNSEKRFQPPMLRFGFISLELVIKTMEVSKIAHRKYTEEENKPKIDFWGMSSLKDGQRSLEGVGTE